MEVQESKKGWLIISRYLWDKYKNVYRVKAFYDLKTNDYPRLKDGELNNTFDDLYIPCASKCYIMHHEQNILMAIIPSKTKGNNIIKNIFEDMYGENTSTGMTFEELYKEVIKLGNIIKIEDCDLYQINKNGKIHNIGEMIIYFKNEYMPVMAKILKVQTSGASISPFSVKNLPKTKYIIPEKDKSDYDNIVSKLNNKLSIKNYNNEFLEEVNSNYKADMKLAGLKGKEYIHSIGKWSEYLDYLKMRIK